MDEWVSTILPAATTTGAISLGSIIGHFHNGHFELSTSCFLRQLIFKRPLLNHVKRYCRPVLMTWTKMNLCRSL